MGEMGSLTMVSVATVGDISSVEGGTLKMERAVWRGQNLTVSSTKATGGLECFASYTTLADAWRSIDAAPEGLGGT